jgi:hypothetical protein
MWLYTCQQCVPGIVLSGTKINSFNPHKNPMAIIMLQPQFTKEETEAKEGLMIQITWLSKQQIWDLHPGIPAPRPIILTIVLIYCWIQIARGKKDNVHYVVKIYTGYNTILFRNMDIGARKCSIKKEHNKLQYWLPVWRIKRAMIDEWWPEKISHWPQMS